MISNVIHNISFIFSIIIIKYIYEFKGAELLLDDTNKLKVVKSLEKNEVDFSGFCFAGYYF